jgi:glycosyltransferase involved in cell wall biosynthesis
VDILLVSSSKSFHVCVLSATGISKKSRHLGGVQTHTKNLVFLLRQQGYAVSLITKEGEEINNGALTVIPALSKCNDKCDKTWYKASSEAFLRLHSEKPVDCVFSEGEAVWGAMKTILDKKIAIVACVHNLRFGHFYDNFQEVDGLRPLASYTCKFVPKLLYGMLTLEIPFLKNCKRIVSVSPTVARRIESLYQIPRERITVIHNWLSPDDGFLFDEAARHKIRKQFGISENDIIFILVGSLWRPKGFRVVLRSFEEVVNEIPNSYLFIAGGGEGRDRLYFENRLKRSRVLTDHVRLLGLYPRSELPSLLSAADTFIMSSLANEAFPFTLLEAMSMELPIIATDSRAHRQVLGNEGFFVKRRDVKSLVEAMTSFASNLHHRKAEAIQNKKRVDECFSYELAVNKFNGVVSDVMAGI